MPDFTISGLEFILQLCVEDDERAGTVLAVSNKCAYIHLDRSIVRHLAFVQILCAFCRLCPLQIR